MKFLLQIIVGTSIMLSGLTPAFGFNSFNRGGTQSVNRWPYSFGDRYIYDNGGSSWNYGSPQKQGMYRIHRGNQHDKHRLRLKYNHKRPSAEKLDGLIEHLTRHSSGHKTPYHPFRIPRYDQIGR